MSGLAPRLQAARPSGAAAPEAASPPAIGEEEFQRFQDFFYRKTGIVFGSAKRYFVDRRLNERVAASGLGSLRAYLLHLKYEDRAGDELQRLINAMTVNETYFYREEYQFRCLVASILPEVVAGRAPGEPRPIRLWSLPCSTGEEPYSMAIQLLENWREVDRHDVEIAASDIDTRVIARAQEGLYDDRAVQYLPAAVRQRYFARTGDGRWRISGRPARLGGLRGGQPERPARDAPTPGRFRRHLLPQPAHLLRRRFAPPSGGSALRRPAAGRLRLPRPLGVDEPDVFAVHRP